VALLEVDTLQSGLKRSVVTIRNMQLLKELLIWIICLLAAISGPSFLIGAHFQLYFILYPLILLIACTAIYHILIKRGSHLIVSLVGLPLAYGIYYFNWKPILDGYGLFTASTLHILWVLMIGCVLIVQRSDKNKWYSVIRASFEYWFMILIAIYIVTKEWISFSSEMNVVLLNLFLIYGLLQQLIVPTRILKLMKKL
jgi:hypothetical protein